MQNAVVNPLMLKLVSHLVLATARATVLSLISKGRTRQTFIRKHKINYRNVLKCDIISRHVEPNGKSSQDLYYTVQTGSDFRGERNHTILTHL